MNPREVLGWVAEFRDNASGNINNLAKNMSNMSTTWSKAVDSIARKTDELERKVQAQMAKVNSHVNTAKKSVTEQIDAVGTQKGAASLRNIALGTGIATYTGLQFYKKSFNEFKDYSETLGHLRYALDETIEGMESVSNFIVRKTKGSFFGPKETGTAWYELMTSLGSKSRATAALDPTLLLATAMGGKQSLSTTAELASQIVPKFGIDLEAKHMITLADGTKRYTTELERAYDIWMKATRLTRSKPEDLATVLRSAGVGPGLMGMKMEDFSAFAGIMMTAQGMQPAETGQMITAMQRKQGQWAKMDMFQSGEFGIGGGSRGNPRGAHALKAIQSLWGSGVAFRSDVTDTQGNWIDLIPFIEKLKGNIENKFGKDSFGSDTFKNKYKTQGMVQAIMGTDQGVKMFYTLLGMKHIVEDDVYQVDKWGQRTDKAGIATKDKAKWNKLYSANQKALYGTEAFKAISAASRDSQNELSRYSIAMKETLYGATRMFEVAGQSARVAFVQGIAPMLMGIMNIGTSILQTGTEWMLTHPKRTKILATTGLAGVGSLGMATMFTLGMLGIGQFQKALGDLAPGSKLQTMSKRSFLGRSTAGLLGAGLVGGALYDIFSAPGDQQYRKSQQNQAELMLGGAALGFTVGGPIGAVIGGVVGGLATLIPWLAKAAQETESFGEMMSWLWNDMKPKKIVTVDATKPEVAADLSKNFDKLNALERGAKLDDFMPFTSAFGDNDTTDYWSADKSWMVKPKTLMERMFPETIKDIDPFAYEGDNINNSTFDPRWGFDPFAMVGGKGNINKELQSLYGSEAAFKGDVTEGIGINTTTYGDIIVNAQGAIADADFMDRIRKVIIETLERAQSIPQPLGSPGEFGGN